MPPARKLIGQSFGRLTVLGPAAKRGGRTCWSCICTCSKVVIVAGGHLVTGRTRSCGCLRREELSERRFKHGMAGTRSYRRWQIMLDRCTNPKNKDYKNYGGRGISVCSRWQSYKNFLLDMGVAPRGMTIERRNNDGGYCKKNCMWASKKTQANNTRTNRFVTVDGVRRTIAEWARLKGLQYCTLYYRLQHGWSAKTAVSTPAWR